jgi:predicted metal-binding membrane protein
VNENSGKLAGLSLLERLWVVGGLLVVTGLSWVYTVRMARSMGGAGVATVTGHCGQQLHSAAMPQLAGWSAAELWMTFVMWGVMMTGMMLPTAIPMVLAFARINRNNAGRGAFVPVGAFTAGYLAAWALFSSGATLVQWGLLQASLLSPLTLASGHTMGGLLLLSAGIFQWSPWKDACMKKCRNPLSFLLTHWQPGRLGALRLGGRFGLYCIGCCWLLMLLCFGLGVMNLVWMGVVTLFMLVEKAAPFGMWLSRAAGVLLVAWGCWMLVA